MKKILLVLSVVVFTSCNVFATDFVKITRITNSIQIKRADTGEVNTYNNLEDIPKLMYGSKIIACGGAAEVKIFNTVSVMLGKYQGILVLKHPVSKEIEISRVEPKENKPKNPLIKVLLADSASAFFGGDTKVTFLERYPSIFFEVRRGEATVNGIGKKTYLLAQGEYYEAKKNIVN